MLHILSGDAIVGLFRESGLTGDFLPWREALVAGPTPANLPLEEWITVRAKHLAESCNREFEGCRTGLLAQENALIKATSQDEVVLWFDFDLFCQVNLLYALDRLTRQANKTTHISLVCIDSYLGIEPFTGLAQLHPGQLASLFEQRQLLDTDTLKLAKEAWKAYTAPAPDAVCNILARDTSGLPFLKNALLAHLARFPWVKNGLGLVENAALDLIVGGVDEFRPLFPMFNELYPAYGFGDIQFWGHLRDLGKMQNPLIGIYEVGAPNLPFSSGKFQNAYFKLTPTGKAVLVGNRDNLNINQVDYWLGGVHIHPNKPTWRWNNEEQTLLQE